MRFFTSDLRRNLIKIFCLTLGMAIGFLLIAKGFLEETYDTFLPDNDRICVLYESVTMNGDFREHPVTAGAIAPGVKRYAPQIEIATRMAPITGDISIRTEDGRVLKADNVAMADSCFFDVIKTDIVTGDPHEVLSVVNSVMIPLSLAEKIGEDALGARLTVPDWVPDAVFTVGGIYKDFPVNSTFENSIFLSLSSIVNFFYDGRNNWMGNDMYSSYVKLIPGTDPADLQPHVKKMLEDNIDKETLEMTNYNITAKPLIGLYTSQKSVRTMIWILFMLAVVMLMSAGLNFLLVTIGQMGKRSKEMAVRKCYGTSNYKIFMRVMGESLFFLAVSLGLAVLLMFCFSGTCTRLLGNSPEELLGSWRIWILEGMVCLGLLTVTGVIPAWMYCRTPVAHSFSIRVKNRRFWKLALLSIQFFASGMLMCILVLVGRQYLHFNSVDIGLDYEKLGYIHLGGIDSNNRATLVSELRRLSCVEGVSSNDNNLIFAASGNGVWTTDRKKEVNVADMYSANPDLFEVTGIKIIDGAPFRFDADSTVNEVMVDESFRDTWNKIDTPIGENESLVGKSFQITEHRGKNGMNEYTICGVFNRLHRGGFEKESVDPRSIVMFPTKSVRPNLYIRFNEVNSENLAAAQKIVDNILPNREKYITPYKSIIEARTDKVKIFGLSVMVIGISIIVIALIGLVGFVSDEVQRRAKEIAIRKVTGTPASKIVKLFSVDILKVAVPSLFAGGAVATVIGSKWMSQFTDQVGLSPLSFCVCLILLLLIITAAVLLNTLKVASDNPVDHLRNE